MLLVDACIIVNDEKKLAAAVFINVCRESLCFAKACSFANVV